MNKNKCLSICECNNRLNVFNAQYVATGKAIEGRIYCKSCGERKQRVVRKNKEVRPVTKREYYYNSLGSEIKYFEEEHGCKPNADEMAAIEYKVRWDCV